MTDTSNQYAPDVVSPPGGTLQDLLEERGMSQAELAVHMGRPRKTINEIVKGKAELTPETALQLERVLHVPADFWGRREAAYRAFLARKKEDQQLAAHTEWLKKIPAKAMENAGWLPRTSNGVARLRNLLDFFCVATPDRFRELEVIGGAAFRRSQKLASDPYALAAWLKRGEHLARDQECAAFSEGRFEKALVEARKLSETMNANTVAALIRLCADSGVLLVVVPELPGSRASGAARWVGGKPFIQLSLRHRTDDHFWFTFFHEAGHIRLHGKAAAFIDESDGKPAQDTKEREANTFAAEFLIAPAQLQEFLAAHGGRVSQTAVERFARALSISPGIVVGQLQHRRHIPFSHLNALKQVVVFP